MRTTPGFAAIVFSLAAAACAKGADGAGGRDARQGAWVAKSLAGAEAPPRIELGAGGTVRGHTGCNGFSARYARGADDALTFSSIVSSKKLCEGEPGRSEQRVLRALAGTHRASVDGDVLTLRDAAGAPLLAWRRAR